MVFQSSVSIDQYILATPTGEHEYVDTEIFEKYLTCYSKLELDSLWIALFNICGLFRKLSLQIAINLRFDYAKELDRDTVTYLRELKQKANSR